MRAAFLVVSTSALSTGSPAEVVLTHIVGVSAGITNPFNGSTAVGRQEAARLYSGKTNITVTVSIL